MPKETKKIRNTSDQDLIKKLLEYRTEMAKEKAQVAAGTRPENPSKLKQLRRSTSRTLTILTQRSEQKK